MIRVNDKILLVTETPPGTPNGFGVTLDALFGNLDPKVIYTDQEFEQSIGKREYLLAQVPFHRSKKYLLNFLLGRIPEWRNHYSRRWVKSNLKHSPSVVYSFVYSECCLKYGAWLADFFQAKHFVHIADHNDSFLQDAALMRIIKKATGRAAIGYNMKETYEEATSCKFEVFHNPVSDDKLPFNKVKGVTNSGKRNVKVLFLGSLFANLHTGAIDDICDAISEIGESGLPIELHMFGQRQPDTFLKDKINKKFVMHHGMIESHKRFELMEEYDCYIVPATFDHRLSRQYAYSIPTKLTEVLSTGRPVLFYGPDRMEAYRFCKMMQSGTIISERSKESVCSFFKDLIHNYEKHQNKALKWSVNVIKRYSLSSTQERFESFIKN